MTRVLLSATVGLTLVGLSLVPAAQQVPTDGKSWVGHMPKGVRDPNLPPDEEAAKDQLAKSALKNEWVEIKTARGASVRAFVVHPELTRVRPRAGVAIVVHDEAGLTDWVRGVADQLARHGLIAIAADFLGGNSFQNAAFSDVEEKLNAIRSYGAGLSTATGRVAVVGFGWGGGMSFRYALRQPQLNGAASFYGPISSDPADYANPRVRILGLYGSADTAINENIPIGEATLSNLYTPHVYINASHGFVQRQKDQDGENLNAVILAWPEAVSFLTNVTAAGGGRGGEG